MRILAALAGLLVAVPALAQTPQVTIAESECRNLTVHQPSPDVKYRPGVDAQGRQVAPADLGNRQRFQPPKEITIDVTRRLAGTNSPSSLYKAEANILQLKVRDGKIFYGDQQLGDRDQRAIAQACAEMMKSKTP
ncbi:MAG: hypothetical protein EXQ95_05530 [Alphaproteobacteria bacterium]|nr:hypothetical protein [Alphaproteobacteria bacterium]